MNNETEFSIQALQSGDREVFSQIVDTYSPKIYRLALKLMGDEQEAEDVLQETLMNAYRNIHRFEGRSSVSTWLYRIASNQAFMRLRKKHPTFISVDEPLSEIEDYSLHGKLTDWCCLPEEEFMSAEAMEQLDAAMQELSPALRAVFVLRDLHELSTRETADVLDISESAVKTRLLRARLQLRDELTVYFEERVRTMENE